MNRHQMELMAELAEVESKNKSNSLITTFADVELRRAFISRRTKDETARFETADYSVVKIGSYSY